MKKIDLKAPRYILPIIILPFLILINWVVLDSFPSVEASVENEVTETNNINPSIPSPNLDKHGLKNKFESVKEAYKYSEDYTAMRELEQDETELLDEESKYTLEEKLLIDSINNEIIKGDKMGFVEEIERRSKLNKPSNAKPTPSYRKSKNTHQETDEEREMRLFRQQMLMLDSLTKTPEQKAAEEEERIKKEALEALLKQQEEANAKRVDVSKSLTTNTQFFNTIRNDYEEMYIKAILDEDLKVVDGSRLRIRIMDDINVGGYLLEKGAYIYANVKSFGAQRVYATVESILVNNEILPVELVIYDIDGIEGFYVPASKFTEFTKSLGGDLSTGGTSISMDNSNSTSTINELLFGLADKGIQSGAKATGKAARRNRAKLKYNTIIYLVNPDQIN
ncbi:MAG: hypothetical protein CMO01_01785 [Thalassobius sp.]|nr:hypothetical protein [Thalassovita sp.]